MRNINIGTKEGATKKSSVVLASRMVKTSVMLDQYGNEIDRRTRRIIKPNEDKK